MTFERQLYLTDTKEFNPKWSWEDMRYYMEHNIYVHIDMICFMYQKELWRSEEYRPIKVKSND